MADEKAGDGIALATTATTWRKRDLSKVHCNNCGDLGHVWGKFPIPYGTQEEGDKGTTNAMDKVEMEDDGTATHPWGDEAEEGATTKGGVVFCQGDDSCSEHEELHEGEEGTSAVTDIATETMTSASYERRSREVLPEGTVGIDRFSKVDLFCDSRMLSNIRKSSRIIRVQRNADITEVSHTGHLAGYGDVWYDPGAVANLLSLGPLTKRFSVTFNSRENDEFVVHLLGRRVRRFQRTPSGLYASRLFAPESVPIGVALAIATVEGNKQDFTKPVVRDVERDRRLQMTLMFASDRHLKTVPESLQNCPIMPKDTDNAKSIFGPALGG